MRFNWLLLLTSCSFLLFATPAWAGKLLSWRFDANENRLIFSTDDRVQPKAILISDPTRIIIDLPGIQLDRPPVNQSVGREIKSIRVGQFDSDTTRLVIEFAPGYTVDPSQVKVKGATPTQWSVTLPQPQPIDPRNNTPLPPPSSSSPQKPPSVTNNSRSSSDVLVTRSGLLVNLKKNGLRDGITLQRSSDRNTVDIQLTGALLPVSLNNQNIAINQGGISRLNFRQLTEGAKITLTVDPDSPEWLAAYSSTGGVLIFPKGGFSGTPGAQINNPPINGSISLNNDNSGITLATISSVELTASNTLLIRSDRPMRGDMNWNRLLNAYEIKIPNAQLADSPAGPTLNENSPIYELRLRQEADQSVTILVKPAAGARVERLTQPRPQLLSLEIKTNNNTTQANTLPLPPIINDNYRPLPPLRPPIRRDRPLVILDPGHGGKDAGAIGLRGIEEKDIILSISQQVGKILEQKGVQVVLTRNSDFFVSLQGRTDMANAAKADLFVSIHANSIGPNRTEINGLEVYYFNDPGLANTIYQSIIGNVNVRQRGVRQARFYVLRNSKMPSTLVEVGYVTGDEDSLKITNPTYQAQMANAIARGILEYLQKIRR